MTVSVTIARRNAMIDNLTGNLNSGKLKIYSGTPPANADASLSGNTLLATLTLNSAAFGAASSGTATANAVTSDTNAAATGTATFCRVTKSDDTVVLQGTVGTSGTDAIINSTAIVAGGTVACSAFTVSM